MVEVFYLIVQILILSYLAFCFFGNLLFHFYSKKIYEANPVLMKDSIFSSSLFKINVPENFLAFSLSSIPIILINFSYWIICCPVLFVDIMEMRTLLKQLFVIWNNEEYNYLLSKMQWTYYFEDNGSKNKGYHYFRNSYGLEISIIKDSFHKKEYNYLTLFGKTKNKTEVKFLVTDYLFERNNIQMCSPLMDIMLADYFYKFLEESDDQKLEEYFLNHSFNDTDFKQRYPKVLLWLYKIWGKKITDKPILFTEITKNSCLNNLDKIINDDKKIQYLREAL